MDNQRSFPVDDVLYPFDSHWFTRDGVSLHYIDEGEGVPVVMLHGNPTWSFLYRKVVRQLSGSCRCIVPDYPGFGYSSHPPNYGYTPQEHAAWVKALIEHLELERFVLVVQDWGGPIGLSIGVEDPSKVAGLLLLNTWCWPASWKMRAFSWAMGGPHREWLHHKHNFFVRRVLPWGINSPSKYDPDVMEAYMGPFPSWESRKGTAEFPRQIRKASAWLSAIEERLSRLKGIPKEMVWAKKDPAYGSEAMIAKWRSYFPGIFVTRETEASHYLQEDCPESIAHAVMRLVSGGESTLVGKASLGYTPGET